MGRIEDEELKREQLNEEVRTYLENVHMLDKSSAPEQTGEMNGKSVKNISNDPSEITVQKIT